MRGKRGTAVFYRLCRRIIPAHAGQTRRPNRPHRANADHPRACGANWSHRLTSPNRPGSSPRMRGKPPHVAGVGGDDRIIPAHAGQTACGRGPAAHQPDHPRACGANDCMGTARRNCCGSSPRMRGKQSDFMRKLLSAGPSIIGFAQWLQSSCYCSCFQSSAKTPISRGTTPTRLFLGFQNSITLLLLT